MALTQDTPRTFELGFTNELPVKVGAKIYEGSAVGTDPVSGFARALVSGDRFFGFAIRGADNTNGQNGDVMVRLMEEGKIVLPIPGLVQASLGATTTFQVFATDDGTFTTDQQDTFIGYCLRVVSPGLGVVKIYTPS